MATAAVAGEFFRQQHLFYLLNLLTRRNSWSEDPFLLFPRPKIGRDSKMTTNVYKGEILSHYNI